MDSQALLSVDMLNVSYGGICAVRDVSFHVKEGELVALIGANGAGKTSILRAISGVVPYGGKVVFAGNDLTGIAVHLIAASGICQVPEGRGIFGNLTVRENLKIASWQTKGKDAAADVERVFRLFPRLKERLSQAAETLSGGEQQMLALGRALMTRAKILLLDEPSMGLAPVLVQEIFRALKEINSQGTSILLVEQNANMALKAASRALVLESGAVVLAGQASELLADERIRKAYLGH